MSRSAGTGATGSGGITSAGSGTRDGAWEAEAERLRRERPPHWG